LGSSIAPGRAREYLGVRYASPPVSTVKRRRVLAIVATDGTFEEHHLGGAVVWVGKCIFCNLRIVLDEDRGFSRRLLPSFYRDGDDLRIIEQHPH